MENKKYLSYDDFKKMLEEQKEISFKFWKNIVIGYIENIMKVGDYNYKITIGDLKNIIKEVSENNNLWVVVDDIISNILMKYEVKDDDFEKDNLKIDENKISIAELETLFNYIYGSKHTSFEYGAMVTKSKEEKIKMLKDFYNDIQNNTILVKIFKTEREAMEYVFIEGRDEEQLVDSVEFLISKIKGNYDYDWKKSNNVLVIGNRFFYIQW